MKVVHIKERALLSMILSSIEVYRHETLGLLLGYRSRDGFVIEYGIPYQTAVKGYSWVAPKSRASERMEEVLKDMPVNVIGDFHSHTQWGKYKAKATPSGEDIADMEPDNIYLIVAVNDKTKDKLWHHTKKGSIIGTLGKYAIELGAACILPGENKSEPVKIICPSATGLNR